MGCDRRPVSVPIRATIEALRTRKYSVDEVAEAPKEHGTPNGLDPYADLRHVFTWLPQTTSIEDIEALVATRFDPQTPLAR